MADSAVACGLDRFKPDLSTPVEVFDLASAGLLIDAQMRRMTIEEVPGAVTWCVENHPERWEEIKHLFWVADEYCMRKDMRGLRASIEVFWDAWRSMLDDFIACRDGIRQMDLI